MTQAELVRLCCEDKATVSRAVSILIERGLVQTLQQSKSQLYNALIQLTEAGHAIARKVEEKVNNAVAAGGDSLTESDRVRLYDSLEKISLNLNAYIEGKNF